MAAHLRPFAPNSTDVERNLIASPSPTQAISSDDVVMCRRVAPVESTLVEMAGRFVLHDEALIACADPVRRITSLVRETGDVTSVVIEAMSDGVVSDNELAEIEREISEAEEALRKLRRAAQAVNAAGKPRSERDMVTLPVRSMRNEGPA